MNQEKRYEDIVKLIKEYNEFAINENSNVRLGLASSRLYRDEDEDEDEDKNGVSKTLTHEEFIEENSYYENAGISIRTFGTDGGWFPSSIC